MYRNFLKIAVLCLAILAISLSPAVADEENGIEKTNNLQSKGFVAPAAARAGSFLMIPESSNDTVGMYDPFDGTYLGDIIPTYSGFSTPINAIMGPNNEIYVSDQVADSVFVFDMNGNYLYTYADASDGLNNIRGIDFYKGHLFVTSGDDYVAEFSGPHTRLPDFINDGSDPFDILFLSDGSSLLCDIYSSTDNIRLYKPDGTLNYELFKTSFPEQVQVDSLNPGEFLTNSFSDKAIYDFDIAGTIVQTTPHGFMGRGVYRLGNGNLLHTDSSGVVELDPITGAIITNIRSGVSARFIELVDGDPSFASDITTISEAVGGVANFTLDAGVANATRDYLIFANVSGTTPGFTPPPGLVTIPINWDAVTNLALKLTNTAIFANFYGVLDANGQATASFNTLGPFAGGAGLTMNFAFGVSLTNWDFASNAVSIDIVP